MKREELDVLVCRLPENVLYLSGYWPVSGMAVVVCPQAGQPVLLAADMEQEYMGKNRLADVRYFPWGTLSAGNPHDRIGRLLEHAARQFDWRGKKIGCEGSFETIAPALNSAEPGMLSSPSRSLLLHAFAVRRLHDATAILYEARRVKTEEDLKWLGITHEIAAFGLQAFAETLSPGKTEAEVAAAVEAAVSVHGHGYKGMQHVRAWAQVMSGERTAGAYSPFPATTHRTIRPGELAVLELAVVADGYWADLTRTRAAGYATDAQRNAYEAIMQAHAAVKRALRAGTAGSAIDSIARRVIAEAGYGDSFPHMTGHGLGFKYHEPAPLLHPDCDALLEPGMVTSIEPGIYIRGEWGMRVEENAVIQAGDPLYLSAFPTDLL